MRRFWKEARVTAEDGGHAVRLDDRAVHTPARNRLIVPARALAEAIAAEWDGQGDKVVPATMPMTRAANTVLDRISSAREEVVTTIAAYGATDLVCYRAPHPRELAARQAAAWDPLLDWARERLSARLAVAEGVMFVAQENTALAALNAAVSAHDDWELSALHDLVTLSGSLLIGLAVSHRQLTGEDGWRASRIDEDWNIEEWGEDAEAALAAARRRQDFMNAVRFLDLVRRRG